MTIAVDTGQARFDPSERKQLTMSDDEKNEMTADQKIRAAAATAAATMYAPSIAATAGEPDDVYTRTPKFMADDTLRMARLFEQYIRTGAYDIDTVS